MHRRGDRAEKWLAEMMNGSPTVNSGATFEDGDWRTQYRLYEVKERELDDSIVVRGAAVNKHIERANREVLGPAFMVMTRSSWVYFIVPAQDYLFSAEAAGFGSELYEMAPGMVSKRGQNIKIIERIVHAFRENGIFLWKYGRKNIDVWVIVEASHWLEVCGEASDELRCRRSNLCR